VLPVVLRDDLLVLDRLTVPQDVPVVRPEGLGDLAREDVVVGLPKDLRLRDVQHGLELFIDDD
jgi:hypothetical protein